ncbi:succinylglutamate desuccinylase/aspartoacylase domain-containing protein [Tepidiforma sp.]|uniref:succinylglutamate desuccinylase/aspartoacylase domain-containing protein n=1 Tax=Tepidiforma sp. TaxID=2682230 RepID=UPI002ADE9169|nr:succinylglutamate desuccinylase/aspartoacylase family protein [Tepidiforma sp.]
MPNLTRRRLLAALPALAAIACSRPSPETGTGQSIASEATPAAPPATPTPAPPTPTPTPTPPPRGSETRLLLPGTPHETALVIRHSGVHGPAAFVLGGVHGNEPGAWLAADQVAAWEPRAGTLLVLPRANPTAIAAFVRTFDDIGDLNRLYPGNPESPLAMERMAHAILEAAREFRVSLLLDLHESWAFYAELPGTGTGALGQTITTGPGPLAPGFGQQLADRMNPQLTPREQMIVREGARFGRPLTPVPEGQPNRGRSSLSAGGHVPGLTPVLVEMGQLDQPLERRVELHLLAARSALELLGIL